MVGKQLSALLQILRSNGVAEYQLTDERKDGTKSTVTLRLGPPPPGKPAPRALNLDPEAEAMGRIIRLDGEPDEDDEEEGDPRFLLERLQPKHFPRAKADPRKNGSSGQ